MTHFKLTFATFAVLMFIIGCATTRYEKQVNDYRLVFQSVYLSGGDGPICLGISMFDSRMIRLSRPGKRPRWYKLDDAEFQKLTQAVQSVEFLDAWKKISASGRKCCDFPELMIALEQSETNLDNIRVDMAASIDLTQPTRSYPASIVRFIELLHSIIPRYAGKSYQEIRFYE